MFIPKRQSVYYHFIGILTESLSFTAYAQGEKEIFAECFENSWIL